MSDEKELEEIIQKHRARNQKITSKEINNIAIKIVKDIKYIVETIVSKSIKDAYKELNSCYKDYIFSKDEKSYSLNLFNDNNLFYQELYSYCNSIIKDISESKMKVENFKVKFNNSFAINNFSILTDLLIDIMQTIDQAYMDNIIKSDISIIVDIISLKTERIINSSTLFLCFINELKNKYKKETEDNQFTKHMNIYFSQKAKEKLKHIKVKLYEHIVQVALDIMHKYQNDIDSKIEICDKTNDYSEIQKILEQKKIVRTFREDIQNNSEIYENNINKLKEKCFDEKILPCFRYYSQKLLESKKYGSCKKEDILNNIILPFQINEINTENDDDIKIVCNIPDSCQIEPKKNISDTFLGYYLNTKKELDYTKQKNYENEIKEIIKDDSFIKEFFTIITSKPLDEYFKSKIKFLDGEYNSEFVTEGDFDIFLKDHYNKFIDDMKNNYQKFRDLIIIKQICYKIPAMTDSSMRIYINPIYQMKGDLKTDEIKRKSVLKSALLILLVHELAHLLKAYDTSVVGLQKGYPITPRDKESGRCLIYYIFHVGIVISINYEQSLIVNNPSNWEELDKMRNIFEKTNDSSLNTDNQLDFYLVDENENDEPEFGSKNEYCFW